MCPSDREVHRSKTRGMIPDAADILSYHKFAEPGGDGPGLVSGPTPRERLERVRDMLGEVGVELAPLADGGSPLLRAVQFVLLSLEQLLHAAELDTRPSRPEHLAAALGRLEVAAVHLLPREVFRAVAFHLDAARKLALAEGPGGES